MAEPGWVRHALRMGAFDYRRSVREIREDTARLVMLAAGVLFPTLVLGALSVLFVPSIKGTNPSFAVNGAVRGTVAMLWVFGTFMLAQRTATAHSEVVAAPFVLTTVSPRTAILGGIVAESLRALTYVLPFGLLVTAAAAYAFVSPATLLAVPLVGFLFVVSAVTLGRVLGYGAAWLVARVPFVARHKGVLGGATVLLFFGGYFLLQMPGLPVSVSPAVLGVVPTGWLADVAVIGTPLGWSPLHAAGGLLATGAVLVVGTLAANAVASSLWFGTDVDVSDDGSSGAPTRAERGALRAAISPLTVPFVTGSVRSVAEWALLRTRREPERLNFLFIPVFAIIGSQVSTAIQSDGSIGVLAPALALAVGWLVGAAFGLNPLGDEGAVLPATLLAVPGRDFVRGLVAPSLLFLPVVAVPVIVAGAVGGVAPLTIAALTACGCLVATVGAFLAPVVGMRFPRFDAIRLGNNEGVRPPGLLAAALHGLLTWVPGAALLGLVLQPAWVRVAVSGVGYVPGFLLGLVADGGPLTALAALCNDLGAAIQAIPLPQFRAGLAALLVVGGALAAHLAYTRAVRRFEAYQPHN